MTPTEYNLAFQKSTKQFALDIIRLTESLPATRSADVIARQLLRSATSTAANYRASCIARSDKERYAKLCIAVEEEVDESLFWLEMLVEAGICQESLAGRSASEAHELLKVFMAYRSKLKAHLTP